MSLQVVVVQQRVAVILCNDTLTASTRDGRSTLADPLPTHVWVLEACCVVARTTNFDNGGCSLGNSLSNDSDYHTESFSDSNEQSHNGSGQVVDGDEVEDLLSNDDNSQTRL